MPDLAQVLNSILVPAILAGSWMLAALRPWAERSAERRGAWAAPPALAAGYTVGYIATFRAPGWPPTEAGEWGVYLALLAAVLGLSEALAPRDGWHLWVPRGALAMAGLPLLLRAYLEYTWTPQAAVLWLAGLSIGSLLLWREIDGWAKDLNDGSGWLLSMTLAAALALALALGSSLSLGFLAGSLAAGCGAGWVASGISGGPPLPRAAVPVIGSILVTLLLSGHFFAELPAGPALLILLAPMTRRLVPDRMTQQGGMGALSIRLLAIAVPLVAAIVWTHLSAPPLDPYY